MNTSTRRVRIVAIIQSFKAHLRTQHLHFMSVASRHGLTFTQAQILIELRGGGSLRMTDLAERCQCDNANLSSVIRELEERSLVSRVPAEDRRARLVTASPEGMEASIRLTDDLYAVSPLTRLSDEELGMLEHLLGRLRAGDEEMPHAVVPNAEA